MSFSNLKQTVFPLLAFLLFSSISFVLVLQQGREEKGQISRYTNTSAEQVRVRTEGFMNARIASLAILAERWVERTPPDFSRHRFLQFAQAIYNHYPGLMCINWMEHSGSVKWTFPEGKELGPGEDLSFESRDTQYREVVRKAGRELEFKLTHCFELRQGGVGFETFWPLVYEGQIQGYLNGVFQIQRVMDNCLATDIVENFWIRVYEGNQLIYSNAKPDQSGIAVDEMTVERHIQFSGKSWRLDIQPKAVIYRPWSLTSLTLLIFGVVISLALSILLHLLFRRVEMIRLARDQAMNEIAERKRAQAALAMNMQKLDARVKELGCLFGMSNLVVKESQSLEAMLQGTVELIPPAWPQPELICARMIIKDLEVKTLNFDASPKTQWTLSSDIFVGGKRDGVLEVFYLEKGPKTEQDPFQKEQRDLLNAVAERLGHIIERKQAEINILESEAKFRNLYESSIDGIASCNTEGMFLDANKSFLGMLGYSRQEIRQMTYQNMTPGKWFIMEDGIIKDQLTRRGYSSVYEKEFIRKDGTYLPVSVRVFKTGVVKERPSGIWMVIRDITDRKLAEERIRKTEQSFRDLVENSLTGISIIQDSQVIYQNPEQERLLGPLPRSPIFSDPQSIFSDDFDKVRQFYDTMLSGATKSLETDFRFFSLGGNDDRRDMKWVNCRASLVEYRGKDAILVNMMDITNTKELEHLLRIKDKMSSLGRVAAGIAHEIRNPLSGINIYLNTLEKLFARGADPEKVKEIFDHIQSASDKIEAVIKRVMDFSRPGMPHFITGNINRPIEEAVTLSSVTLRKKEIRIEKFLDENIPDCRLDPHLMEQVILNLVNNAADSMKAPDSEKKIEILSAYDGGKIIVSVSDSGPGVPDNIKDKIFDPFYSTKEGSTGIGLSLCHRIITDHDGKLILGGSKWGGAKFTIELGTRPEVT
jgi:PAS domain S-box-containing protein